MNQPTTILDRRVPQPNDYAAYGVPDVVQRAAGILLAERNACGDDEIATIDAALIRLFAPWIRP